MNSKIWFMEGLSSQRDLIQGAREFAQQKLKNITIFASHRHARNEILSQADYARLEPEDSAERLAFITRLVEKEKISAIQAGRNSEWFESHRQQIESLGVNLTTGAMSVSALQLADDKYAFAQSMEKHDLPVVPSIQIDSIDELKAFIVNNPFKNMPLCVKPIKGIYGMGFWRFDDSVSAMAAFTHPESRRVNPRLYLQAMEQADSFEPLVLMPYLPGPEYSVDMVVEQGHVIAAVARRKEGSLQHLENSGEAYELGCACAQVMQADGIVNVQTRNDAQGNAILLEINMRPSGGIGYTQHSGINLPGIFALRQLGLISQEEVVAEKAKFTPSIIRPITNSISYSSITTNLISTDKN